MLSEEVQDQILDFLYGKWFENPFQIVDLALIIKEQDLELENKDLEANADILVDLGLIEAPRTTAYPTRITISGITAVESRKLSLDINNRRAILEFLKKHLEESPKSRFNKQMIIDELGLSETVVRRSVWYLEKMGLINVSWYLGANFTAVINAFGIGHLEEPTVLEHESKVMSSAYFLLYQLENEIRRLIQTKLIEKYGRNLWESGISLDIRRRAEHKKEQDQLSHFDLIYYTDFGDLRRIIINNWDKFREIFDTQGGTLGRLEELEEIRNDIAHTRLLTKNNLQKLVMFHKDIISLCNIHN